MSLSERAEIDSWASLILVKRVLWLEMSRGWVSLENTPRSIDTGWETHTYQHLANWVTLNRCSINMCQITICICVDMYTQIHTHTHRVTDSYAYWITRNNLSIGWWGCLSFFWGAEILKLMSLLRVWWMKFLPATEFSRICSSQCSIHANFKFLLLNFSGSNIYSS